MAGIRILVSGDYWHNDFRRLLSESDAVITLVPLANLPSFDFEGSRFDLIVFAQTRRDQIEGEAVDQLRRKLSGVPIVNLLGSWCEGETRSGDPLTGVLRVYWHQWTGRYANFLSQLHVDGVTDWNLPLTANIADRIESGVLSVRRNGCEPGGHVVGISAVNRGDFDMLRDAVVALGWTALWLERVIETGGTPDSRMPDVNMVAGQSLSVDLKERIDSLETKFPQTPKILVLNFPRTHEEEEARDMGVCAIVSKPYELQDLQAAIDLGLRKTSLPG